nr:MAPEG family protein [Burkholderiales bacterium]
MTERNDNERRQRTKAIVKAYPFGLLLIAILLNLFAFGVHSLTIALPSSDIIFSLVGASVLLLINHSWLMTSTELTRVEYDMHATPEEWMAHALSEEDASAEGVRELDRRHGAHRNTTENVVYFVFLALIFAFVSPAPTAALAWIVGFPIARLGYTYCYLT